MNLENVYSFSVQRQNSAEVPPGKSPCVKIKFIKDESAKNNSPNLGVEISEPSTEPKCDPISDDVSSPSPLSIYPIYGRDENSLLKNIMNQILQIIDLKDKKSIFSVPVTEDQAPNYSMIIENPMDLQTISRKISLGQYESLAAMLDDVILMCQNALIYNTSDTVYFKIASQLLNFAKKTFSFENLSKIVINMSLTKTLTDDEFGDLTGSLARIKLLQKELSKVKMCRSLPKTLQQNFFAGSRKRFTPESDVPPGKRACLRSADTGVSVTNTVLFIEKSDSEPEDSCSNAFHSDVLDDDDYEDCDETNDVDDVVRLSKEAAKKARQNLLKANCRPIYRLEQRNDNIVAIDVGAGTARTIDPDIQSMVRKISSVNIDKMLGDNQRTLAMVSQICYSPNEVVSLTTSKPLEPFSCAEQAVLVETFGDIVTAEFACNMHNYVLDLPPGNPAIDIVKSRLNSATNYLTYGVDQIIVKKLKGSKQS